MKKTIFFVTTILLVCTLLSGCGNSSSQADKERLERTLNREIERTEDYKKDLAEAEELNEVHLSTITHLESELSKKDDEISTLNSEICDKDKKISLLEEQVSQKDELLSSLNSEVSAVTSLQSQLSIKEEQITSLQSEISKNKEELSSLNSEISKKDDEISGLKKDLENASSGNQTTTVYADSSSYLALKFWLDGNEYYTNGITWYSDIACQTELTSVTIISPTVDTFVQSNGYTVYACMTKYGLVYSSTYPYLLTCD